MRKGILVGLLAFILLSAGGLYYLKVVRPMSTTSVNGDTTPTALQKTPPTTPATIESGVQKTMTSETHPAAVDLSVDEKGLSKSTVVITTNKGVIKYKFYSKDAEKTTTRMIELIQEKFYDGLSFHRVVPGFVIQGGDPNGDGTGGSKKDNLPAEFNSRKHVLGTVAMARSQKIDSANSQFYICLGTHSHLDGQYTVFGQVVEGLDVIKDIKVGDKMKELVIVTQ